MKRVFIVTVCLIIILSAITFFSFRAYFSPDSCWYYYLSLIFDKTISPSLWWSIRGFTFPLYLFLTRILNGDSLLGISISLYFLYFLMLTFSGIIIMSIIRNKRLIKIMDFFKLSCLFAFIFILNPIIIGYSHIVLTETMAPVIVLVSFFVAFKWFNYDFKKIELKSVLFILIISILFTLMWFLKQPYLPIIAAIFTLFALCKIVKNLKTKDTIYRIIGISLSVICLILAIKIWDGILLQWKASNDSVNNMISSSFVGALSSTYVRSEMNCDIAYVKESKLKESEKKLILEKIKQNKCSDYYLYDVINFKEEVVDNEVFFTNSGSSTLQSIGFVAKQFLEHPISITWAYYNNYMTTIDLHGVSVKDNIYYPGKLFLNSEGENMSLAMYTFNDGPTGWWQFYKNDHSEDEFNKNYAYSSYTNKFTDTKDVPDIITNVGYFLYNIFSYIFKISFWMSPILSLIYFIKYIKNPKDVYNVVLFVIYGASFLHILFHAVTGAIIDRYAYIAFPLVLIGLFLIIFKNKFNNTN